MIVKKSFTNKYNNQNIKNKISINGYFKIFIIDNINISKKFFHEILTFSKLLLYK